MLENKVVIVTGGAGLLGKAFCHAISKSGGIPVVADIDEKKSKLVADEIEKTGAGKAFPVAVDITNKKSLTSLVSLLHNRYGKIDALVNNAYPRNKNYGRSFFEVTYEDFCENLNLHVGGYFLASQVVLQYFKDQGSGNIVNVGSIYGSIAPRFEIYEGTQMTMPVEYAAIKSGIIHLTKYIASLFAGSGIRANCISPGGIFNGHSDQFVKSYGEYTSHHGMLRPHDITGTLLYLLSDQSLSITGQNIIVDDGFSL